VTEPTELRSETLVTVDAVKCVIAIARGGVGSQRVTAKKDATS
jgi:hypothetical protein